MTTETKPYKGYIVLNSRGVPLYPSLATNKWDAIRTITGDVNEGTWARYKAQGYSVQRCSLVVPVIKKK